MKHSILFAFFSLILVSCSGYEGHKYGRINPQEKTIVTPRGAEDPILEIKDELRKNGWKLYTGSTGVRTSIRKDNHRTETYLDKRNARYALEVEYKYIDIDLLSFSKIYYCAVSLIDLKTQEEIYTARAKKTTLKNFNKKFIADLNSMTTH